MLPWRVRIRGAAIVRFELVYTIEVLLRFFSITVHNRGGAILPGGANVNVRTVICTWFERSAIVLRFVRYPLSIDTVLLYLGKSILKWR